MEKMDALSNRNSVFYKLKNFFRRIFSLKEEVLKIESKTELELLEESPNFKEVSISYFEKNKIAENIINDQTYIEKLTPEETQEMIDFFENDIKEIDKKIEGVKERIERMRKKGDCRN